MSQYAFKGGPVVTLDGKGRVTVPARYRDTLVAAEGGRMFVTKSRERCLLLLPGSVWDRLEAKINAKAANASKLRRRYVGSATEVAIDGASRVLLPPELREWAGIERDVVFMGLGSYFELWDKARLQAQEAADDEGDWNEDFQDLIIE